MAKKINKEVVEKKVSLKPLNWKYAEIHVQGVTDLMMERDDGTCAKYYDAVKAGKVVKKDTRMEKQKVEGKIHHTEDGKKVAYPSGGFSTGMRKVAYSLSKNMSMRVKESVRFLEPMVPIKYTEMVIANHGGKRERVPCIILRPMFKNWFAILKIKYDADLISLEQIVNLINRAGVRRGLGAFRPEKGGEYGQYEVIPNEKR